MDDVNEFYQESEWEESYNFLNKKDTDDESEETLSFCDLPIYGNATDFNNQDFSKEDQSSSFSASSYYEPEEDYFEFFSEEWNSNSVPENIIFCGKLIPSKQPICHHKKPELQWNSDTKCHTKARQVNKNDPKLHNLSHIKSMPFPPSNKCNEKYDFSVGRVPVLRSQSRARRGLFMFGLGRFPLEMELSDIRNRVNRQRPQGLSRPTCGGEKVAVGCRIRWKGLWRLVRILGCGGSHHANAVVKASFGNIPYV